MAAVHQPIQLPSGIYEFTIWAKGDGAIVLKTEILRRRGDLGREWAKYSLTFEQAEGRPGQYRHSDRQHCPGGRRIADAGFGPTPGRLAGTGKARAEYGFVPEYFAAQSPQPGAPAKPAGTFQGGPVAWREKAVFYDKRYDNVWVTHPESLAQYLGANGFRVLEAAPFGQWMKSVTRDGAYGTVCVMTHGLCPASVYNDNTQESPIHKYMAAGGRVVWLGDVPFYYVQDDVHPQLFGKEGSGKSLGVRGGWDYACWASQGKPKVSALGKTWGLADAGGPTIAAYPEDVTAALSGFHSDYADSDLAVYWFKNFSPLFPWSGFIAGYRGADMANPALQQSVYRLALYAGKPVEAPAGIASVAKAAAQSPLKVVLDPPRNRRCYYRGETIPVHIEAAVGMVQGGLRLNLVRNGESFPAGGCRGPRRKPRPTSTFPPPIRPAGITSSRSGPSTAARKPWLIRPPFRSVRGTTIPRSSLECPARTSVTPTGRKSC